VISLIVENSCSAKLVSKSVDGYAKLERNANTKGAKVSSDAPFRSQRHSAAYERATKAKGFAGYYENVFADSQHKETNPPEERDGLDGMSNFSKVSFFFNFLYECDNITDF
jgi:hypothetical protein